MKEVLKKKAGSVICGVLIIILLGLFVAMVVLPLLQIAWGDTAAIIIMGIYALSAVATMAGIMIALRQRIREINSGEEEEAKKY